MLKMIGKVSGGLLGALLLVAFIALVGRRIPLRFRTGGAAT